MLLLKDVPVRTESGTAAGTIELPIPSAQRLEFSYLPSFGSR